MEEVYEPDDVIFKNKDGFFRRREMEKEVYGGNLDLEILFVRLRKSLQPQLFLSIIGSNDVSIPY